MLLSEPIVSKSFLTNENVGCLRPAGLLPETVGMLKDKREKYFESFYR